jgi:HTH-type transcriptional regulator, sugar sensing transcriptional regulator
MDIEDFLEEIGLSQYEKKAYLTLLSIGKSKSKSISKESGVSYGRIYEIMDKLEKKGLIAILPTEPKTFDAIEPKLAFKLILKKREEKLSALMNNISTLTIPEKTSPIKEQDKTIVLQGKQKQLMMIGEMHERAKKEILMVPGIYEPSTARNVVTLRALNKGVKIKRLIKAINSKNKDILERSSKLGEEVRKNNLPGLRLIVTDNKESMISIVNPKSKDRISIYTTNKEFANSMSIFFSSLWDASKKVVVK